MKIPNVLLLMLLGAQAALRGQSIVVQVAADSTAGRAGIQTGDVLTGWDRGGSGGEIRSPFEVSILELETAGFGPVTLIGRRGGGNLRWLLDASPWGFLAGPLANGGPPPAYAEGQRIATGGQGAEAAANWERAARQADGIEAVWLLSRAGAGFAEARHWEDCDRTLSAALQRPGDGYATLHLERQWADAFYQRNAWDQAKIHYDRALAEAERLHMRGTEATILYETGRLYIDRRQAKESHPYLSRALAIRQELAPGSIPVAQTINSLGRAFLGAGDLKQAGEHFQRSLDLYEKLAPGTMLIATTLHNLGIVALERDDLDLADKYLQRSLAITVKFAPNGVQWANTATSLANVARDRGDLPAAERYLEQVLTIRRERQPGSLYLSSALNGVGNVHRLRGELTRAENDYREALAINTRLAPMSREVAGTIENLGLVAQLREDWPLALTYYRESVGIWEKVALGTVFWAKALANLAQTLGHLGRFSAAEQQYREILKSFAVHKVDALSVAGVTRGLGELHEHQGQMGLADEAYTSAFETLNREIPGSLATAEAAFRIAELARRRNQWERAETYYRKCLSITETLAPGTEQHARPLYGLAMAALHHGQKQTASDLFSRALQALENQAPRMGGSEQAQAFTRASYASYYQDYILFLVSENRIAEAFAVLERSRARALLQMLAQRDIELKEAPLDLDLERRRNAADYDRAQSDIAGLSPTKDPAALATLQARLLELTAERAHIVEKIRQASPNYAGVHDPAPLDLQGIQASLDPGTVLISFAVTPARTVMFVVHPGDSSHAVSAFTISLGDAALREKVMSFRKAIEGRTFSRQALLARDAVALYDLLLRPAEPLLARAKRLLIVPDGPLDSLPFGALRRGNQFLIEWKPLHSALSATLYAGLKRDRRAPESYRIPLAAFGDPVYATAETPAGAGSSSGELRDVLRSANLRPLPFSRAEVEQIAALYPDEKRVFLGRDASEEHAKSIGTDVRYIHFAVHALVDERFALNSALVLTVPENPGPGGENGLLQVWELYAGVRWDADLVVLSACRTGLGQEMAGEGLFGLTRAVQYAGARSVIGSLWSVDDRRTQQLMTALYRHLREGIPKDEALRSAQIELLSTRTGASPFYWAGFVLTGDWK